MGGLRVAWGSTHHTIEHMFGLQQLTRDFLPVAEWCTTDLSQPRPQTDHERPPRLIGVKLNHLHLHVTDLERARVFYERWFGFEEHAQYEEVLFLRDAGALDLALAPDPSPQSFPAWFHFGFRLDSAQDVQALHDKMAESGVAIVEPYEFLDGLATFRCTDPDGYQIEVYWE